MNTRHQQARSRRNRRHQTTEILTLALLTTITHRRVTTAVQVTQVMLAAASMTTISKATTNKVLMVTETSGAATAHLTRDPPARFNSFCIFFLYLGVSKSYKDISSFAHPHRNHLFCQ